LGEQVVLWVANFNTQLNHWTKWVVRAHSVIFFTGAVLLPELADCLSELLEWVKARAADAET